MVWATLTQAIMDREKIIAGINKKCGEGSVFRMGDKPEITNVHTLPSGLLCLDHAIGVRGFPRGRIAEIYGPEAAGKSTLALSIIAETQRQGGYCAFVDAEHALSPSFAQLIGVNTDTLYYSQPDYGEQGLQVMEELIASSMFDVVALDSVAALTPRTMVEGNINDKNVAYAAQMMAKALQRMTSIISKTKTVAIFINQLREKPMTLFGSPEYTPGGRALKFYASLRIDVKKHNVELEKGKPVAHTLHCIIKKNKVAPPFAECDIRLDYRNGIDRNYDLFQMAKELGVIRTSSSWLYYKDMKWNGVNALREHVAQHPEILKEIAQEVKNEQICDHKVEERTRESKVSNKTD